MQDIQLEYHKDTLLNLLKNCLCLREGGVGSQLTQQKTGDTHAGSVYAPCLNCWQALKVTHSVNQRFMAGLLQTGYGKTDCRQPSHLLFNPPGGDTSGAI
jgi:hypothetical protein